MAGLAILGIGLVVAIIARALDWTLFLGAAFPLATFWVVRTWRQDRNARRSSGGSL